MLKTLLIFSALAASTPLQAQSSDDSLHVVDEIVITGSRLKIPTHNTAAKIPLSLRKTPLSVGIVDEALIEAQDGATLSDALANISGVGVHTNFGVHDLFYLRGFDSLANGLVLSDGAPEPEATFYQLYNVDRVEVLKGPGAFLYGGNPLSGTINLVRKRPDPTGNFARINSSIGRYATYRATVDVGRALPEKNIGLRFNALWQETGGYRDDKDSAVLAINPALRLELGERATLDIDFEYLTSENNADSGLPLIARQPLTDTGLLLSGDTLPDVPRTSSYQSPFDLSEQTIQRFRAGYEWRLNPHLTLRNKFYYTNLDWPSQGTLFNGTLPTATDTRDLIRILNNLDDQQTLIGNQLESLLVLETGAVKHQVLCGFEFSRHEDDFTLDLALLSMVNLVTGGFTLPPPLDTLMVASAATDSLQVPIPEESLSGQTTAQTLAPYIVDRITISPQFELFIGGRFDLVDYDKASVTTQLDTTNTALPPTYLQMTIDANRNYRQLSPLLGAVFTPNKHLSLYANTGRAFAPPSPLVVGDQDPEKSYQYEIGAKTTLLNGKLIANFALFNIDKENIAIPVGPEYNTTRQIGDQRSRGLELELVAQPTPNWYAQASYAYLDAELTRFIEEVQLPINDFFDRSGNSSAFAPEHLLTLWAARDLGEHLTLAGGARYVGSQFAAEDNIYTIDGTLTFDLGLTYRHGLGLLRINLKNITSSEYETRGFGAASVIPAPPFTFKATLGYSL